jgi:hypothetical protein
MNLGHGQVSLEVDDENAVYPVTIDPVFNQQARLLHSNGGPNDFLGKSVAIYGDTAVVGAHNVDNRGSAYVFVRSNGSWGPPVELTTPNFSSGAQYGYSVAISGNTVVVGAHFDNSGVYHGSAFVFERSGSSWGPPQKLEPSDSRASGWFGHSVAISLDTIVVGAPLATVNGNSSQGSAVVFVRNGNTWIEQQKLIAGDGAAGNYFGYAVAIAGNTAVATAPWNSVYQPSCLCYRRQGAAYVFTRSYQNWSQQQKLSANDGEDDDRLGYSVAINSSWNTIVVGAPYDNVSGRVNQGSAYIFTRNISTWSQQWKLTAGGGAANDWYGYSVAISGYEVVVGAPLSDVSNLADQGSVYVYARSGSTWTLQGMPTSIDLWANHRFGYSVAISVGTIVAGAPFWDYWGYYNAHGAALVFVR